MGLEMNRDHLHQKRIAGGKERRSPWLFLLPMPNSTAAAVARKQQRQGASHAEVLVVCIGSVMVLYQTEPCHKDRRNNK
jgi:hypothetical protein